MELGGSYTAPSGDNVFVTAAANLTLDGVSIESNLIEGERLSIRWETLLRLLGLTDDEVNQIMALRDVDWDNAMEELSTVVAQAAEEIGKLVEPYLATFADFLASLDIQQRDNVAGRGPIIRRSITRSPSPAPPRIWAASSTRWPIRWSGTTRFCPTSSSSSRTPR